MDFEFKVPSTVPQDLLLIQDLIAITPPVAVPEKGTFDAPESSDDSIASTDNEPESEDEVEAGLAPGEDDSGITTSDSASYSGSDTSSSDSEEDVEFMAPQQGLPGDADDEESSVTATATYLQTKNEIVDACIMVPAISEVDPYDTLEKIGEIMSIVGNIVIVRGLPVDHVKSSSARALDAESLLVFEDRKVFGYIYETFGPTCQPLYQVKFNEQYPLDTHKVWVSREVFHVPRRSHFVFVNQLKNIRGSDASNIHDEEPADDEIEFSDDEEEAAFKAQRKRMRGRAASSSRQSTPVSPRVHSDSMVQGTYGGSNPYDAHGPYDDGFQLTGSSRPLPVPYDDPYADVPTSDAHENPGGVSGGVGETSNFENGRARPKVSRTFHRGTRGRGVRPRELWSTRKRGHHVTAQRTFDSNAGPSFSEAVHMVEPTAGHVMTSHPVSSGWASPATNGIQGYEQDFVQPHINPRFAAVLGFNLPSANGSVVPWAQDCMPHQQQWASLWPMHGNAGPESEEDTYRSV